MKEKTLSRWINSTKQCQFAYSQIRWSCKKKQNKRVLNEGIKYDICQNSWKRCNLNQKHKSARAKHTCVWRQTMRFETEQTFTTHLNFLILDYYIKNDKSSLSRSYGKKKGKIGRSCILYTGMYIFRDKWQLNDLERAPLTFP